MFSNLRTEVAPNHDVLPRLHLVGYQEDLVTIPETPRPELDDLAGPDPVVPAYEVGRRLARLDDEVTDLTIEQDGVLRTLMGREVTERFPPPGFLESKLIRMRVTERSGPVACRH